MPPLAGSAYCWAHDTASAVARAAARKKGGRNRRTPNGPEVGEVTLRTVESAQQLLEQVVGATLKQENSGGRSRTLGYLLQIALRALEVGEIEARIAALEARLGSAGTRAGGRWLT